MEKLQEAAAIELFESVKMSLCENHCEYQTCHICGHNYSNELEMCDCCEECGEEECQCPEDEDFNTILAEMFEDDDN
jgi:hypothetical protein